MSSDFPDDYVINFHDAVLYKSDILLIQTRSGWLNDSCINFFMTYLDKQTTSGLPCRFLDPSLLSFFMHQCTEEDEITDFVQGVAIPKEGKVFLPVNDNMATGSNWQIPNSGSHWSLLVLHLDSNGGQAWHFDSVKHSGNLRAAKDVVRKMEHDILGIAKSIRVTEALTPQQTNGYDCGVHVLAAAEAFADLQSSNLSTYESNLRTFIDEESEFCKNFRRKMLTIISSLPTKSN